MFEFLFVWLVAGKVVRQSKITCTVHKLAAFYKKAGDWACKDMTDQSSFRIELAGQVLVTWASDEVWSEGGHEHDPNWKKFLVREEEDQPPRLVVLKPGEDPTKTCKRLEMAMLLGLEFCHFDYQA